MSISSVVRALFHWIAALAESEDTLLVWAGDQARQAPDFVAVVDFDPDSPRYGKILRTVPLPLSSPHELHHLGNFLGRSHLGSRRAAQHLERQQPSLLLRCVNLDQLDAIEEDGHEAGATAILIARDPQKAAGLLYELTRAASRPQRLHQQLAASPDVVAAALSLVNNSPATCRPADFVLTGVRLRRR